MCAKTLPPEHPDFGSANILYPIPSRAYPNWSIKFCADVPQICFKLKTCIHKIAVVDLRDWCRQGKSVFRRNPVEFQGETARPWRRQKRADAANSLWIQVLRVSLYLISVSHHVSASWNSFVYQPGFYFTKFHLTRDNFSEQIMRHTGMKCFENRYESPIGECRFVPGCAGFLNILPPHTNDCLYKTLVTFSGVQPLR